MVDPDLEHELLQPAPGMIALLCTRCPAAMLAPRMVIDPPSARLAFFPCPDHDDGSDTEDVIYTDANRNPVGL